MALLICNSPTVSGLPSSVECTIFLRYVGAAKREAGMAKTDAARLAKLRDMLERLKRGEIVLNRQLRIWLGHEDYAAYERQWSDQQELRDDLADKPDEIKEYERLLKRANFIYNKAEGASQRGRKSARKLFNEAEDAFERVLERGSEIVGSDPSLSEWFDRDTKYEMGSTLVSSPDGVPKIVTSRGANNGGGGILVRKMTKRELKTYTLECAIGAIERPIDLNDIEERARRFSAMIRSLDERD
jgi:hypothetical protein